MNLNQIILNSLEQSMSYQEYRALINDLLSEKKSTGHTQSEALTHYSELNVVRMHRLDKTISITEVVAQKLASLSQNYLWLVISEGWCGDAAQLLPIMHKMAEASSNIELKIVLRDDHDALMQHFLTNGGKSIPKLIVLNKETMEIIADWGPRPLGATKLIQDYKSIHGVVDDQAKTDLQKWYLHDKGLSTQEELVKLIS